jgi:hypothetical protein
MNMINMIINLINLIMNMIIGPRTCTYTCGMSLAFDGWRARGGGGRYNIGALLNTTDANTDVTLVPLNGFGLSSTMKGNWLFVAAAATIMSNIVQTNV